jgi:hypothetical protein
LKLITDDFSLIELVKDSSDKLCTLCIGGSLTGETLLLVSMNEGSRDEFLNLLSIPSIFLYRF